MSHEYSDAELHRRLAEDTAIAELDIDISVREGAIVLSGHVESVERLDLVAARAAEHFAPYRVINEIVVVPTDPPTQAEELR
jgi:malonyl CoA-acyl carrier protein transacylase